ncbi:MAG: hypothetical protein NTX50_01105, partial [Candidatus Sumerlaeota bacterium]|nr:hypothetical protein [Candidatus Sumerlaeota bacterium]
NSELGTVRLASGFAALLFVATPVVLIVGCWEFIDLGIAAFFFGFVYALAQWAHNRQRGWLVAAGFFGAGCLGTKYTMIPLVALGGLWVAALSLAATARDQPKPLGVAIRRFLFIMGIAGVFAAPWYLKNWAMTGNPVYPLAWGIFRGGEWSAANDAFYKNKALDKGFSKLIRAHPARIPEALALAPYATAFEWRTSVYANSDSPFALRMLRSDLNGPQSENRKPKTENQIPQSENQILQSENRKPKTENPIPQTENRKPKTENPIPQSFLWGGFEDHNIGPGYLLLLPMILGWIAWSAWRWRRDPARATIALFMIAYAGLWFFTYQSNRFLIPLLGLACVAAADMGFAIYDLRLTICHSRADSLCAKSPPPNSPDASIVNRTGSSIVNRQSSIVNRTGSPIVNRQSSIVICLILSAGLAASLVNGVWAVRWIALDASHPSPLPVALGFQSRDDYLSQALPQYGFLSHLDGLVEKGAGVLFIGEHRGYYCRARYLASDWFDTPHILALIRETPDNEALFARLLAENVRYVFFNYHELGKYTPLPLEYPNPLNENERLRFALALPLFYDRFTEAEWRRFTSFCASPRLKRIQSAGAKMILAEILPAR